MKGSRQWSLAGVVDEEAVVAQARAVRRALRLDAAVVHQVLHRNATGERHEVRDQPAVTMFGT